MKEKIKRIKKKYNICGVMRSSAPNAMAHTVNQLARNLKIPVFTWQHGHVGFNKIIDQFGDYFNLMTSDYTFVFGKGSQKAHETSSQSFPSKIHITGSASIDSLKGSIKTNRSNKPSSKTRVLYATTNYYQNHWYFGMLPGLSDRHLYLDQKTIYQALLRLQKRFNLELTIKLYPSDEFLEPPWARDANFCGPQVKFVKGEKSFTELLLCHDIVILDSPSTTLLQALSTTLPVFILMRYWRYPPPMMRSLSRRIVCKEDAEELISDLEKLLIDQNYPVDLLNVDFLKEFGTHTDDGQSAQRTMHYMNTILNES
jgi:hypothetical protein